MRLRVVAERCGGQVNRALFECRELILGFLIAGTVFQYTLLRVFKTRQHKMGK
jgi:hypothetical protein